MGEYTVEKKCENCKHQYRPYVCARCHDRSKWVFAGESEPMETDARHKKLDRAYIMELAMKCVCGDRERDYGSPEDNFGVIAAFWTTYKGVAFTSKDVAMMMCLLKIARIKTGMFKRDSYVDACGYMACAGEIAGRGNGL